MAETTQEKIPGTRSRGKAVAADGAAEDLGGRSFEDAMRELDGIVGRLEQGSQPLEQSLRDFEAGVALLRGLHRKLSEVEERVEILLRDADGVLRTRDGGELAR